MLILLPDLPENEKTGLVLLNFESNLDHCLD